MKRVLVTGARGFIGCHCLPMLVARGYDVHAVSSRGVTLDQPGVTWHRCDLLDRPATDALLASTQPSHLLHLAWYTEHGLFWHSPANLDWAAASLHLLGAFQQHAGQRVVTAGTCAEYSHSDGPCSEVSTPLTPTTLYGTCKHALQLTTTAFANEYGLSSAWGRVFFLIGPGEHPNRLVPSVIRALLEGRPALCSPGNQVRDFLRVDDVASAFVALVDSGVTGAVNIGSGQPLPVKELVLEIGRLHGRSDLIRLGALPPTGGEPPAIVADIGRLREEVGWRPMHSTEAALLQSIAWWREREHSNHGVVAPHRS